MLGHGHKVMTFLFGRSKEVSKQEYSSSEGKHPGGLQQK